MTIDQYLQTCLGAMQLELLKCRATIDQQTQAIAQRDAQIAELKKGQIAPAPPDPAGDLGPH